ncbi:MAG: thioredoxin domain-containing protein [Dehalococcoidia bacterium]|nr:thioredoxin domain-containing protein [Dehalococcoidia bacterium]
MTPELDPPPAPEPRPAPPARPLWTAFLTPGAILIGAVIISATIWLIDRNDSGDDVTHMAAGGSETSATGTATSPTSANLNLKTAMTNYAAELKLDAVRFDQCLAQQQNVALLNTHVQRGREFGVTGTPTFFINNKMVVGAQPTAVFDEVIEKELAASPTSLDQYSATIQQLAAAGRFAILDRKPDVSDAEIEGNPMAKVMVAEFSDFQCPFCRRWNNDNLERIRTRLGNDVAMAFLHFPITQIHPNAANAAVVAMCAGEQDKFWEMHDLLFARQAEWQELQ